MAHALALAGTAPELAGTNGRSPLLAPSDLVHLGVDATRATTEWERAQADELGLAMVGQPALCEDPRAAANTARATILAPGPFVVHLDVDVLDFLDAPIAEHVNGRNSGPTIAILEQALVAPVHDPDCWEMSMGQLDPAHASADPTALPRLIAALASALSP
ncbi:hypothetical protein [Rhodococcoides fascians]|uniref:hypothetical protein n=1 Tax=Rhodococcoides fascians TaxID=1828 RepID=UPI001E5DDC40|nr:hypothetical protein [Rhodococcus fascians]